MLYLSRRDGKTIYKTLVFIMCLSYLQSRNLSSLSYQRVMSEVTLVDWLNFAFLIFVIYQESDTFKKCNIENDENFAILFLKISKSPVAYSILAMILLIATCSRKNNHFFLTKYVTYLPWEQSFGRLVQIYP